MHAAMNPVNHFPPVKTLGCVVSGAIITFSLFVLMDKLTQQKLVLPPPSTTYVDTDIVLDQRQEKTIVKQTLPAKPKVSLPATPSSPDVQPKDTANSPLTDFTPPKADISIDRDVRVGIDNSAATPIIRMQPDYPVEAARNGIEGWVQLQFTIGTHGQVKDVRVLDAQPKRIFDQAARKALLKWKYKPTMFKGKPIEQAGLFVVLDFKLNG